MATKNPTDPARPTPPAPGSRPSVRVDDALSDDLGVIMRTGLTVSDAVRQAVAVWADMHRTAWANGVCEDDTAPRLLAYQLEQQVPRTAATNGYDAASDTAPRPRPASRRLPGPPPGRHLRA